MERLPIINHNSFRAIGFHKSRSSSSPYGPAPQGSQLITLNKFPQKKRQKGEILVLVLLSTSVCFFPLQALEPPKTNPVTPGQCSPLIKFYPNL